mmetsp:Transcript_6416/g.20188  ORF Transcript_6416/g.20188 Transcript_6416/m.20188 type:complete len:96 (-) Transcript_6416:147-434(-)
MPELSAPLSSPGPPSLFPRRKGHVRLERHGDGHARERAQRGLGGRYDDQADASLSASQQGACERDIDEPDDEQRVSASATPSVDDLILGGSRATR